MLSRMSFSASAGVSIGTETELESQRPRGTEKRKSRFASFGLCVSVIPPMSTPVSDPFQRPLRDLRISVTDRCNFRCPYCMPAEIFGPGHAFLRDPQLMTLDELTRIVRAFRALGAEKVRITGGEPLLRADVSELVRALKQNLGVKDVALTTKI